MINSEIVVVLIFRRGKQQRKKIKIKKVKETHERRASYR